MVNWYTIKINAEDEWLNAFVLDPGLTATDMGVRAVGIWGLPPESLTNPEEIIDGFFKVLNNTKKDEHGGKSVSHTGEVLDW